MSMPRLCASALVLAGFVLSGSVKRARRAYELERLRSLNADIRELASKLVMTRMPLCSIADSLADKSRIPDFWREFGKALGEGASPSEAFERANTGIAADEAAAVLKELFSGFGKEGASAEAKKLERAVAKLDALIDERSADIERSNKLTGSLSVLTGLAAALLLL